MPLPGDDNPQLWLSGGCSQRVSVGCPLKSLLLKYSALKLPAQSPFSSFWTRTWSTNAPLSVVLPSLIKRKAIQTEESPSRLPTVGTAPRSRVTAFHPLELPLTRIP